MIWHNALARAAPPLSATLNSINCAGQTIFLLNYSRDILYHHLHHPPLSTNIKWATFEFWIFRSLVDLRGVWRLPSPDIKIDSGYGYTLILDNKYFNESSQFHEDLAAIFTVGFYTKSLTIFDVDEVDVGVYSKF